MSSSFKPAHGWAHDELEMIMGDYFFSFVLLHLGPKAETQ